MGGEEMDPVASRWNGEHRGRKLDYVPRLVEANNRYLVRDAIALKPDWNASVWWTGGLVLDQGSEGACVGFGTTGEAMASPVRQRFRAAGMTKATPTEIANSVASDVYHRAKEIDEWEGVDYDGTSVRAGLLVGRERGWWAGFNWAKNLDEVLLALTLGPVVIGVEWREEMYETDEVGRVTVGGGAVGGHCLLVTGFSPRWGKKREPRFRWRNSWSLSYGVNGNGYVRPEDLKDVCFDTGGEAGVVRDRKLVPSA